MNKTNKVNELTEHNYYDRKDYLSASTLKYLLDHPDTYRLYLEGKLDVNTKGNLDKSTEALRFGSAYHTAVLEPLKYPDDILVCPSLDMRKKESKERMEQFFEEGKDKILITEDDDTTIQYMHDVLEKTGVIRYFEGGNAEVIFTKEIDGIKFKGKVDYLTDNDVIDLKTTRGSAKAFVKDMYSYHYDLQAYMYRMLTGRPMTFVAQSKGFGYYVGVYPLVTEKFYESGERKFDEAMNNFIRYFSGESFDYPEEYYYFSEL